MLCPNCSGTGREVLFTSSNTCPTCKGTGHIAEEIVGETCAKGNETSTEAVTGDGGARGDLTITAGNGGSSGTAGDITITASDSTPLTPVTWSDAGYGSIWTDTPDGNVLIQGETLTFSSSSGPPVSFQTGTTHPDNVPAPVGSLYFRKDADCGLVYIKFGPEPHEWTEVKTARGRIDESCDDDSSKGEGPFDDWEGNANRDRLVKWAAARIEEYGAARRTAHEKRLKEDPYAVCPALEIPEWMCGPPMPVVAPLFVETLADLISIVEQRGHEVNALVTSCRDFADVRKMPESSKVRWRGGQPFVFGVQVLRSPTITAGFFCAVSGAKRMAMCEICR